MLNLDTVVDAVTTCPQGQFLLVGERSGSLHIIYVPLKKTVLTKVSAHLNRIVIIADLTPVTWNCCDT